jgi:hypothetical protein
MPRAGRPKIFCRLEFGIAGSQPNASRSGDGLKCGWRHSDRERYYRGSLDDSGDGVGVPCLLDACLIRIAAIRWQLLGMAIGPNHVVHIITVGTHPPSVLIWQPMKSKRNSRGLEGICLNPPILRIQGVRMTGTSWSRIR